MTQSTTSAWSTREETTSVATTGPRRILSSRTLSPSPRDAQEFVDGVTSGTTTTDDELRETRPRTEHPIVSFERVVPLVDRVATHCFLVLQQWEGTVQSIEHDEFTARMVDRTNPAAPQEMFRLGMEDVDESDRSMVVPGGVFYMTIGYRVATYGERVRSTLIRFRRGPRLGPREIARARARAAELSYLLDDE